MYQKIQKKLIEYLQKIREKPKSYFLIFLVLFISIISTTATVFFHHLHNKQTTSDIQSVQNNQIPQLNTDISQITSDDQKELNVLLIGYGGAGHQGGMLADLIQIAHLDFEQKTLFFISIPRDLELRLDDGSYRKINNVFSSQMTGTTPIITAGQTSKELLSALTNLNIKYFIAVDFVGFQRLIGQELGGIEVEVKENFVDSWYPIEGKQLDPCGYSAQEIAHFTETLSGFSLERKFACRYEEINFPAGLHQMEGGDALKYVRSRHSTSDFDRSRRQVEVLTGIRKKLFTLDALSDIPYYFKQVQQHVHTDFDLAILQYFAPLLVNANEFTIHNINLSTENVLVSANNTNGSVLIPKAGHNNWTELQNYIQQAFSN